MVEAEGRRYPFKGVDAIDREVLETFPYEHPEREAVVTIETDEFTAVCPYSGLPDFGTLRIHYVPDTQCVELKSFKYYLISFRDVGIYQEHAAAVILRDFVKACAPRWVRLELDYRVRGGIHTVVTMEEGRRPVAMERSGRYD